MSEPALTEAQIVEIVDFLCDWWGVREVDWEDALARAERDLGIDLPSDNSDPAIQKIQSEVRMAQERMVRRTDRRDERERDNRYKGMTKEEAWEDYFSRNPNVLASWGHQNDRWPNDDIIITPGEGV